jgi:FkbM family methyltransferase
MLKDFSSKEFLFKKYLLRPKSYIFNLLTKNALPIFLKGGDVISTDPLIFGCYETRVRDLINFYALSGYGDYLIDIGANIGLSSCQSGNFFQEVHCYEPNPDCFNILKVNTRIALIKPKVVLNNFGLGDKRSSTNLYVPRGNWGGGFIHDENNAYSDSEIGSKDGYIGFDPKNYDVIPIIVESGTEKLTDAFESLEQKNLRNGFIKIDAEGYEPIIIGAIAGSIPKSSSAVILFECHAKQFDPTHLLALFKGRATAHRLVRSPEKHVPKILRFLKIIYQLGYKYQVKEFSRNSNSSDIVFIIEKVNQQ